MKCIFRIGQSMSDKSEIKRLQQNGMQSLTIFNVGLEKKIGINLGDTLYNINTHKVLAYAYAGSRTNRSKKSRSS